MKGLVADANIQGQVEHLVKCKRADAWTEFWQSLDPNVPRIAVAL